MDGGSRKLYLRKSVLEALQERLVWLFDRYEQIFVSVSGGKDSTVLFHAAREEAARRNRTIHLFFLDQEAEYQSSIDIIQFQSRQDYVRPWWFQVPILMTNATSYDQQMLYAWEPGAEWVRPKDGLAIHSYNGCPDRFYPFFTWFEQQFDPATTCFLVGLRSEESLNRYRAVTRHPALPDIRWSSRNRGCVRFYPLYDWTFEDIWTYIAKFGVRYNRVYDWLYIKQRKINEFRVSNLIHEKAFHCLTTLQEFEPETYDRLVIRLKGVHTAALYAREQTVFSAKKRPAAFPTWRAYRDFLLDTIPTEHAAIFLSRFSAQNETDGVFRQQVRQLLINDWENNIPVIQTDDREAIMKKWMEIL